MPSTNIIREIDIVRTSRVMQLEGIFDIPPSQKSVESWGVDIPYEDRDWNIGLIVGPSGSGKTTIINEMFTAESVISFKWEKNGSILDSFPKKMSIKDITNILDSVGFSAPPLWVRPYYVLSTGQKFRVDVARALVESDSMCVIDEFTSTVDRTVAKIGSAAVSKTIRRIGKKFIAATCHYDVEDWLQPDWVYRTHDNSFEWRFLQQRPKIQLKIGKVHRSAWKLFKHHHYLTANHHKAAQCFVAWWGKIPVAFISYLHFVNPHIKRTKRGHRVVVLPDYQGVGIGQGLINHIAACLKSINFDFIAKSAVPGIIYGFNRSKNWEMIVKPKLGINAMGRGLSKISCKHHGRIAATFRYIGPGYEDKQAANSLLNS